MQLHCEEVVHTMQVWISFHTRSSEFAHGCSNVTELNTTAPRRFSPDWNMNRAIWESAWLAAKEFKTSLLSADLQALNTRIWLRNTYSAILSSHSHRFNGANPGHPWQPRGSLSARTRSSKSLSPLVRSHYCTCTFCFTHKRSKACQQAARLLQHTMHREKELQGAACSNFPPFQTIYF